MLNRYKNTKKKIKTNKINQFFLEKKTAETSLNNS